MQIFFFILYQIDCYSQSYKQFFCGRATVKKQSLQIAQISYMQMENFQQITSVRYQGQIDIFLELFINKRFLFLNCFWYFCFFQFFFTKIPNHIDGSTLDELTMQHIFYILFIPITQLMIYNHWFYHLLMPCLHENNNCLH